MISLCNIQMIGLLNGNDFFKEIVHTKWENSKPGLLSLLMKVHEKGNNCLGPRSRP